MVIAELLGIPDGDRPDFRRWSDATIEATDRPPEETAEATGELFAYLMEHIAAKKANPGDDVVSLLVGAEVDGRSLDRDELLIFLLALLVAGNETTRTLISGGTLALFEHPDQRADLVADPTLIPAAVEECLRWVTPIQAFARTVTADTVIGGVEVKELDYLVHALRVGQPRRERLRADGERVRHPPRREPAAPRVRLRRAPVPRRGARRAWRRASCSRRCWPGTRTTSSPASRNGWRRASCAAMDSMPLAWNG